MKRSLFVICIFLGLCYSCKPKKQTEKSDAIKLKNHAKQNSIEVGEKLFKGKGNCISCHHINKNSIGPSITEIVKIYKEQNADMVAFLKQEAEPIVQPEHYSVMKTNFAVLKTFSEEELEALTKYIYAFVDDNK